MNYLIFDNDLYYDLAGKIGIAPKSEAQAILKGSSMEVSVALIDTLQKQVAAPEKSSSRKDEVIASSFTGGYLTQSERIAENLFQVIAVEKEKINQVYKCLGSENVRLVVPYAVALREFLENSKLLGGEKRVVFLDHLGDQVLLTIFNKKVFTAPRRLSNVLTQITRELVRSQEGYRSQNKTEAGISFLVVTNSQEIIDEIVSNGLETKENIVFVEEHYPALSGLKIGGFSMHYMLPEQFIRLRKIKEAKKRILRLGIMLGVLAVFLVLVLGSMGMNKKTEVYSGKLRHLQEYKSGQLRQAYREKYQDILRREKKINFPDYLNSFLKTLPAACRAESISIRRVSGGCYRFEAIASQEAKDEPFTRMNLSGVFKQAKTENILVKDNPGLKVTLDIF